MAEPEIIHQQDAKGHFSIELYEAASHSDVAKVRELLATLRAIDTDQGNPNDDHYYMRNPLMVASYKGHTEIVSLLLDAGASVDVGCLCNMTAVMWAALGGRLDVLTLLAERGADVKALDDEGDSTLLDAAKHGHTEVVEWLLDHDLDIDHHGGDDMTALIWATYFQHHEVVSLLLRRGADVNATDCRGWTALHWAMSVNAVEIMRMLIEAGADFQLRDSEGETPFDVLSEIEDDPVALPIMISYLKHSEMLYLLAKARSLSRAQKDVGPKEPPSTNTEEDMRSPVIIEVKSPTESGAGDAASGDERRVHVVRHVVTGGLGLDMYCELLAVMG